MIKALKIKLLLSKSQTKLLKEMSNEYISSVNTLVQSMVDAEKV